MCLSRRCQFLYSLIGVYSVCTNRFFSWDLHLHTNFHFRFVCYTQDTLFLYHITASSSSMPYNIIFNLTSYITIFCLLLARPYCPIRCLQSLPRKFGHLQQKEMAYIFFFISSRAFVLFDVFF